MQLAKYWRYATFARSANANELIRMETPRLRGVFFFSPRLNEKAPAKGTGASSIRKNSDQRQRRTLFMRDPPDAQLLCISRAS